MSVYEKQVWVDGVTPADAEHFNHMEEGIAANAEENERLSKTTKEGVKFTRQDLTDEQKAQARNNIGAVGYQNGVVMADISISSWTECAYKPNGETGKQLAAYRSASSTTRGATNPLAITLKRGKTYTVSIDDSVASAYRLGIAVYKGSEANVDFSFNSTIYATTYFPGTYEAVVANKWHTASKVEYTAEDDNLYMVITFIKAGSAAFEEEDFAILQSNVKVEYIGDPYYLPTDMGEVNANRQLVTDSEGKVTVGKSTLVMPEYWSEYLHSKLPVIRNKVASVGVDSDMFMFFTDHHIGAKDVWVNTNNTPHILDFINRHTPIEKVFFGGDILNTSSGQTHEQALRWLWEFHDNYINRENVYPVIGNHDILTQYNTDGEHISYDEAYSILFKKIESEVETNKKMYYTLDNPSQKIRYIVLDSESESINTNTEQLQWLIDVLSALEDGWTALLFAHSLGDETTGSDSMITNIAGSYNSRTSGTQNGLSWDFTESSGVVACVICGHSHVDWSTVVNGVLVILTTTDAGANIYFAVEEGRAANDVSEHAVDLFFVNTASRTIETIRLGYGNDRAWTY